MQENTKSIRDKVILLEHVRFFLITKASQVCFKLIDGKIINYQGIPSAQVGSKLMAKSSVTKASQVHICLNLYQQPSCETFQALRMNN